MKYRSRLAQFRRSVCTLERDSFQAIATLFSSPRSVRTWYSSIAGIGLFAANRLMEGTGSAFLGGSAAEGAIPQLAVRIEHLGPTGEFSIRPKSPHTLELDGTRHVRAVGGGMIEPSTVGEDASVPRSCHICENGHSARLSAQLISAHRFSLRVIRLVLRPVQHTSPKASRSWPSLCTRTGLPVDMPPFRPAAFFGGSMVRVRVMRSHFPCRRT